MKCCFLQTRNVFFFKSDRQTCTLNMERRWMDCTRRYAMLHIYFLQSCTPCVAVGRCLAEAGVFPDKTVDVRGRELFHALAPGREFEPLLHMNWYHRYSLHRHFQVHYATHTYLICSFILHSALANSSLTSTVHREVEKLTKNWQHFFKASFLHQ